MSAGYTAPDFVSTFSEPFSPGSKPATPSFSTRCRPWRCRWPSAMRAISGSSGARICAPISTSVTSKRRWIRFSAVSMPMKPPPMTTARVFGRTVWKPA